MSLKSLVRARRPMWGALLIAAAATLGAPAPAAGAATTAQVGVSGTGVLVGAVVQIPLTAIVPIQACNNNVAVGLIAVSVSAYTGSACSQG